MKMIAIRTTRNQGMFLSLRLRLIPNNDFFFAISYILAFSSTKTVANTVTALEM